MSSGFSDSDAGNAAPAPLAGQPVFAMSFYFDVAVDVGLISENVDEAVIQPQYYAAKAQEVCALPFAELPAKYPASKADRLPFLCMDLCYLSSILVDGFKIAPSASINLAKKITFNGAPVETQWTLGAAIEELSKMA